MGRSARFSDAALLDAAAGLIADASPAAATIAAVAARSGAPVGSIYHRFCSIAELLSRLWLERAEAFQGEFLRRLDAAETWADALPAAMLTPEFARDDPTSARILLLHRREDFLRPNVPAEQRARADVLGSSLRSGIAHFSERALGSGGSAHMATARFALIEMPLAATKPWLAERAPVPDVTLGLIRRAFLAIGPA